MLLGVMQCIRLTEKNIELHVIEVLQVLNHSSSVI